MLWIMRVIIQAKELLNLWFYLEGVSTFPSLFLLNIETFPKSTDSSLFTEPARYQVQLKIYNLAVEDLFEPHYLDDLLSIFRAELWPEAIHDLHVSFFASAVHLGARLPLRPEEKEGSVDLPNQKLFCKAYFIIIIFVFCF